VKIDEKTHLFERVDHILSPHHNYRPSGQLIDLIVIHGISLPPGEFGNSAITDFFCGKLDTQLHPYFTTIAELKVSSHLLIDRTGHIVQFVPFDLRAWHAGQSEFKGLSNCNDFSIGIELEGTDDIPYEKIQYERLADCIVALQQIYPLVTRERIVGHSDIAPGRKTDPGPHFDWAYFDCLLIEAWHNCNNGKGCVKEGIV